jgi:hypothetical protein
MNCYIVYIKTGELTRTSDKLLKVFSDRSKAEEYSDEVRERLDEIGYHKWGNKSSLSNPDTMFTGFFQDFSIDYTGAWVTVNGPYLLDE